MPLISEAERKEQFQAINTNASEISQFLKFKISSVYTTLNPKQASEY